MQLITDSQRPGQPVPNISGQPKCTHEMPKLQDSTPLRTRTQARREVISSWNRRRQTPLGYLQAWSATTRNTTDPSGNSLVSEEHNSYFALYPSWVLAKLGVSYGLLIQARCTDGWQYTIQPFNAVPDDALIFTFCSNGNVAAVKTLLATGKASLRDRDSRGWTPLRV